MSADSAPHCRAHCEQTRGCNLWVWCGADACTGQCWLKWTANPRKPPINGQGSHVPWTSGALLKDFDDGTPHETDESITHVALVTAAGRIRIHLRCVVTPFVPLRAVRKWGNQGCVRAGGRRAKKYAS